MIILILSMDSASGPDGAGETSFFGSYSSSSDISAPSSLTQVLHPTVELCCDSLGF